MVKYQSRSHKTKVLITGFGQMGHAMQTVLGSRAQLNIWRVTPQHQQPSSAILKAIEQSRVVILCVPTLAISLVLKNLIDHLDKHAVVLCVAKGLDEVGHTSADILQLHLGMRGHWGVLGGPMIADELRAGGCGFAELGSRNASTTRLIGRLFDDTQLHLIPSRNPRAVSWCGVLKNIYVPLFGLADGLGWGDNLRGQLASTALGEINRLVHRFNGLRHAADGTAGLADLITTATSHSSHHRALGRRIAHGDRNKPEGEGPHSLRVLLRMGHLPSARMFPLLYVSVALVQHPSMCRAQLAAWIEATV